ncbi:MAG: GTPase HflX [Caldisericia bacterium]
MGARLQEDDQREALESFKELSGLIATLGADVVGRNFQVIKKVSKSYLFGKGKVEEIKEKASEAKADRIVFDYYLTPLQSRNLEESLKKPVIDRAGIIIEVFANHASTSEGKLQVELAQLKYKLPRLTDRNMRYDQQTGGGGSAYLRGAGETKKELIYRRIRQNIRNLRKRLDKIKRHRQTQAKLRDRLKMPIVSLVGYTNAGKSTLLSALTGADILIQDKLFSTLDTTVRKRYYNGQNILFTDTVGFIRNLPVELVAAFRSTLEEVLSGWLLLVVFDVSNPDWKKHLEVVESILDDLGATHIPKLYVGNKVDKVDDEVKDEILEEIPDVKFISASTKIGTDELLEDISETLRNL